MDEPRFSVRWINNGWAVLDAKRMVSATFHEGGPVAAAKRAETAAARLNDGSDTPTGYVWE
jgi:hypothetical protein